MLGTASYDGVVRIWDSNGNEVDAGIVRVLIIVARQGDTFNARTPRSYLFAQME